MKCTAKLIWAEGYWHSEVFTENQERVCLTLEADSFDILAERVRVALPEMVELNFGYTGDIQLSFEVERVEDLVAVAS